MSEEGDAGKAIVIKKVREPLVESLWTAPWKPGQTVFAEELRAGHFAGVYTEFAIRCPANIYVHQLLLETHIEALIPVDAPFRVFVRRSHADEYAEHVISGLRELQEPGQRWRLRRISVDAEGGLRRPPGVWKSRNGAL